MARKIVLLVEAEQPEGLSARKLIVESLRHHVFLAHNSEEALSLLQRIQPDVVLIHGLIEGQPCREIVMQIRRAYPKLTIVALTPGGIGLCGPAPVIDSSRPQDLVRFFESSEDPQPA
jgi:CheY-like chemotaxis protein